MSLEVTLASGSASRRALLAAAGVTAQSVAPNVDEASFRTSLRAEGVPVRDQAMQLAELKAVRVSSARGGLVIGGGLDHYLSYAQRGNMPVIRHVLGAVADQLPALGRVRLARQWAGIVDVVHDSSPILGETPVPGLFINCGWGTGGFKAIPVGGWMLAHHIATGRPHDIAAPFALSRFLSGALIDEAAASGIPH